MDENLTKEEHTKQTTKEYPMCANHPLMKTLFIGFLIFAGAYCAFYTVADWYMKNFLLFNLFHLGWKKCSKMI